MLRRLPDAVAAVAREYAEGRLTPVEPVDAATVLLLRDSPGGPEVFVMVRHTSMAFAGGMVAFPGGKVEPHDATSLPGPLPVGLADRLGAPHVQAAGVLAAVVRETIEETGVELAPADLGVWDAWTTPIFEPRRYRTWFFTAALPEGQRAEELSTESSEVAWVTAEDGLARVRSNTWAMLPPTLAAFVRLAGFGSVAEVMAVTRDASVTMVIPEFDGVDSLHVPDWVARS